jgi:hypothetical protein
VDNIGKALDTAFWRTLNGMVPTGTSTRIIHVWDAKSGKPLTLDAQASPQEQSRELVLQAAVAYHKLRDQARQQFEATGRLQDL